MLRNVVSRALTAAYLLGIALIVFAARGDLWLDELWSLSIAETSATPWEIISRFPHDNNHVLNTLFLHFIGPQSHLFLYRVPAALSGISALFLLGRLARRWGAAEELIAVLLAGTSFPLIIYFSEARGYGYAVLFALLSCALMQQGGHRLRAGHLVAFWACVVLGILSHLTFVTVLLALLALSVLREFTARPPLQTAVARLAAYYAPPLAFLAWFYLFFVRRILIGGGVVYTKWEVVTQAAAMLLGLPDGAASGAIGVACVIGLVALGACSLYRRRDEQWILYPAAILAAPALLVFLTRPTFLYFRYFILAFPFVYLLLACLLGPCFRDAPNGRRPRALAAALILILVSGQSLRVWPLLRYGRGAYRAAMEYIAANSAGRVVRIGSDHDFRNATLVTFYSRFLPPNLTVRYVNQADWRAEPPDWILTQDQDQAYVPPRQIPIRDIGTYRLRGIYRYGGVSGWNWFLYGRAP